MDSPIQLDNLINVALRSDLEASYADLCAQNLKINMMRGVPSPEQLALSKAFLHLPGECHFVSRDGVDWRNYGGLQGMPELRELFSEALLGVTADCVAVGENSSLALMHEALSYASRCGVPGSQRPWGEEPVVKFVCPVPGYDRHFSMCDEFKIKMLPVPLTGTGPDMD